MSSRKSASLLAARRAVETRALYQYEVTRFTDPKLRERCSITTLRRLARRVWEAERGERPGGVPSIAAGRGVRYHGRWFSYCEGRSIVLARHERTRLILLHELTHALGYATHGVRFRARYFALVARYGGRLDQPTREALAVNLKSLKPHPLKRRTPSASGGRG